MSQRLGRETCCWKSTQSKSMLSISNMWSVVGLDNDDVEMEEA